MNKRKVIFLLICFIVIFCTPLSSKSGGRGETAEGLNIYVRIKTLYNKWDLGLYGSRKYYRGRLYRLLLDMTGKRIVTDYDYVLLLPDAVIKKSIAADSGHPKWLHIHGTFKRSDIEPLIRKGRRFVRDLERRKYLFSLSGRIKSFRLQETGGKRFVHLYLDEVGLRASSEK